MKINQKIPEGWSVKKLGDVCYLIAGNAFDSNDFVQEGIPLIRISNIDEDKIVLNENTVFLKESFLKENEKFKVQYNDLLIAMSGATTGKMGINTFLEPMLLNQRVCIIRAKNISQNYLNQYLFTHKKDILKQSYGGAQPNIGNNDIKKIKLLLPPLCEQEQIAEILGTWDLAIEKLTALIEQKKLLKKGLMQRLLTGKQRLPGFSTPWKKVKLGDVFLKSLHKNKEAKDLPVLTNSAAQGIILQEDYFDREIVTKENLCNYYCTENGDFIYNPRISKNAPAGPIRINHFREKGCISPLYTVFKIKTGNYPFFYEIYFESNLWIYEAYKVANYGARSDRMNITDDDFFNMKIPYPSLPEQKAIADILSKADEEIDLLTRKLDLLQSQKKGLMQQLLTGKIRVKVA